MSGHNTCISCGEYCAEYQMICVNCKHKVKEARYNRSLRIVFCSDGSFDVRRGDTVVRNCDDLEYALAEFMKEYDRQNED